MSEKAIYRKLQQHLDRQPVGYPATLSGSEIGILKHIFSPEEAGIALKMSYKFENTDTILMRMDSASDTKKELEQHLDSMFKKGGILSRVKNGGRSYALAPLIVGMYELQGQRLTPEFIRDFNRYTKNKRFGVDFISTDKPQMRTIPIAESITPEHRVGTFDDVNALIDASPGPFAIVECICRKKKALEGTPCQKTERKETCLAIGDMAEGALHVGNGRAVEREEAREILAENQKEGLVLQPSNSRHAEFICSCCGCCCGMLDVHRQLPRPLDFWAANFHARIDTELCNGCGVCAKRCQVNAVRFKEKGMAVQIDEHLCLGCGACVPTCPKKALSLENNVQEITPPETMDDLYDTIMEKKKGPLAKVKIMGKLFVDAIRSGRFDVLVP